MVMQRMSVILMRYQRFEKISCKPVKQYIRLYQILKNLFGEKSNLFALKLSYLKFVGFKISLNDLVIKAVATTLQYIPEVNLNVLNHADGDDFQIMPSIDISVAVATNEGLITPIVKNVPSLTLPEISNSVKDLALRARNGQLKLDEFQVMYIYLI